jgi:glycolate oxidase
MGTPERITRLARELRGMKVHTDRRYAISYSYDATGERGDCGGVVFPEGIDDLRRIVRVAAKHGAGLYVRGAGSGFSGGAVPLGGGLVVSLERLDRILAFDAAAETVTVESGTINESLQEYLYPLGYFYPPDPASLKFSTIGGNIAENAGGPRAYRYGVTRRYVRSVTWITPDGDSVSSAFEGPAALLASAEGTLGIIYAAVLSVVALPEAYRTAFIAAGADREALCVAAELLATGFRPTVLEFIDSRTMSCVGEYRGFPGADFSQSYLFVEMSGSRENVAGQYALLERYCVGRGRQLVTARGEHERELLWDIRRSVSPSLARRGITKFNEDVSFPLGRLGEAVGRIHDLAREYSLDCYIFGHCGDGNLHVNIMTDRRRTEEMERVGRFIERLFAYVTEAGGTLSGEHGIGLTKRPYLGLIYSSDEMRMHQKIKRSVDKHSIFNNGKYFSA